MIQSKQTFHFKPPIPVKGDRMIGLTDLEIYYSIFIINTTNNKFRIYKFPDEKNEKNGGITYEKKWR